MATVVLLSVVRLLPACPQAWLISGGSLSGVRARGGVELSFSWKEGVLQHLVTIRSAGGEGLRLLMLKAETTFWPARRVIRNFSGGTVQAPARGSARR